MSGNTASGALHCPACHEKQPSTELITQRKCVACGHLWRQKTLEEFVAAKGATPRRLRQRAQELGLRAWFTDECAPSMDAIEAVEAQVKSAAWAGAGLAAIVLTPIAILMFAIMMGS